MVTNAIRKQAIRFPNSNEAVALFPPANNRVEEIVNALDLSAYKAVILILGGADGVDQALIPRLTQLFGRGIARAAEEAGAVLIDGGTKSGVMALMGEGVAGRGYKSALIGVAPASKVALPGDGASGVQLEPNHSRFVLVEGDGWGSETATMYKLAGALSNKTAAGGAATGRDSAKAEGKVPTLAVLAGGGPTSRDEVLRAIRQNLPLIVVEGSGGLADEIAAAWKQKDTLPDDPVMAEIIADGEIHMHLLSNSVKGIERLIIRELGVDNVLMQAWETFADYDLNATLQQKRFRMMQFAILVFGLLATTLAIVQQVFAEKDAAGNILPASWRTNPFWWFVYYILILLPITITVLITAANRFKQGSKWLLLRAGAESIKREIYRYRARAMNYKTDPEEQLAARVEDITRRTMRTEVNSSALVPYKKELGYPPDMYAPQRGDDGFSYLTPDRYVEVRLGDQLTYFRSKCVKLEKRLRLLFWLTFIIGGIGTFLAAINLQVWIAVTTALVAAIGTYLGYMQVENTLTKYNQAATDLSNVKTWWNALSADEQSQQANIDSLVEHTEQVLQSELDGWVQQMQNALADLRKGQEPTPERNETVDEQKKKESATGGASGGAAGGAAGGAGDSSAPAEGASTTAAGDSSSTGGSSSTESASSTEGSTSTGTEASGETTFVPIGDAGDDGETEGEDADADEGAEESSSASTTTDTGSTVEGEGEKQP